MDLKSRRGVQLSIALSKVMYRSLDPKKAGLLHFMTMFLIQFVNFCVLDTLTSDICCITFKGTFTWR